MNLLLIQSGSFYLIVITSFKIKLLMILRMLSAKIEIFLTISLFDQGLFQPNPLISLEIELTLTGL